MGYAHIENLYKPHVKELLFMFREVYALEKIHGCSAEIKFTAEIGTGKVDVSFDGGLLSPEQFSNIIDKSIVEKFVELNKQYNNESMSVFGELYGGSINHMSKVYGEEKRFVVFDVKVGDVFLSVPQAEDTANRLGLEFVSYKRIPVTIEAIDAERDAESVQAIRVGMGSGKYREGVVLRPLFEARLNNGERIVAKHKRPEHSETKTPRTLNEDELKVLSDANEVAEEWVTETRLQHVLDKITGTRDMKLMGTVIKAMTEDVYREAHGEIVESKAIQGAISKKTVALYKNYLETDSVQ